jgi:hypothetical protein
MHDFTRHMLAGEGSDDNDDTENQDASDDGSGSDDDRRKSARKSFAALQKQMLAVSDSGTAASRPKEHASAANAEELIGGLRDGSVRYWSDFQQVTPRSSHDVGACQHLEA